MSSDIRRVGDAGVHTIEGNIAGSRAAGLTKQRERQRAEYETMKEQIKKANTAELGLIDAKFSAASDIAEQEFRRKTVGLVTADEFRKAREEGMQDLKPTEEERRLGLQLQQQQQQERIAKEREVKRKRAAATLSFTVQDDDDEEEAEEGNQLRRPGKMMRLKDPTVDTSFLPDPQREREITKRKEELKVEWLARQEVIKNEVLAVHALIAPVHLPYLH
jgi:protein FAM50